MRVSFRFDRDDLIMVPVRMRHVSPAWPNMVLDTGARVTVVTPRIALELGFGREDLEPAVTVHGATGSGRAAALEVPSVSLMGMEVANLRVLCHPLPAHALFDGILGMNFLNYFEIEISNKRETVTLTRWRE